MTKRDGSLFEMYWGQAPAFEAGQVPGFVVSYSYRMDADPNDYYLAVVFESREAHWANAQSPEQDARYRQLLPLLEGEPEWHDGELVYALQEKATIQENDICPGTSCS